MTGRVDTTVRPIKGPSASAAIPGTLKSGVLATLFASAVLLLGPLVLVPLFVKYLGPADYGIWLIILTTTNYLFLLNLGIGQTVGVEAGKAYARSDPGYLSTVLSSAWVIYWAVVLFVAVPIVITGIVLAIVGDAPSTRHYVAFAIAATCFLVGLPLRLFNIALRAEHRVHEEQLINTAVATVRYCAIAAVLVGGLKLLPLAAVYGLLGLLPGLIAWLRLRQLLPELRIGLGTYDRKMARSMLTPSAAYWTLSFASILAFGIDNVVIGAFLGAEHVPAYAVSMQLVLSLHGVIGIASTVASPIISARFAQRDSEQLATLYWFLLRTALLAGGFVALVLWITGSEVIQLWAGQGIFPGDAAFAFMLIFMLIQISVQPADSLLQSAGRHFRYARLGLIEAALNVALSIWWVQVWGMTGVIAATVCARLATNGWYLHLASLTLLGQSWRNLLSCLLRLIVIPLAAAALALAFVGGDPHLLIKLGVALAAYSVAIACTSRGTLSDLISYIK